MASQYCTTTNLEREKLFEYNELGRLMCIVYTVYLFTAWLILGIFCPTVYEIWNRMIPPSNSTRGMIIPVFMDYVFFEQQDYPFTSTMHIVFVILLDLVIVCGNDILFVTAANHLNGLLRITSSRLENIGNTKDQETSAVNRRNCDYRKIVTVHCQSIRLCEVLEEATYKVSFILTVAMVGVMSGGGFYVLHLCKDQFMKVTIIFFICGINAYLVGYNWQAQQIIDTSSYICESAYACNWIELSSKDREHLILIMARASRPCAISAGKVIVLSMETYGKIMKSIVSYLTAFESIMAE